ncbi:hypothetical protein [Epilithonimonas hungarica]|uniref:Uncharacterized protein n=1 Tax=Epilithonimonas hungarica TaxID=454006 RepID=A0A1G7HRS0_9FLAO|nr:hypothetical protein [Epilithonimonas hungarica]SDF02709.1 hypothetical protein SAMN05421825_0873 [Epilithonimonas hungarica]
MDIKIYNEYLVLYQLLTNSFVEIPSHYKDGFYKCYQKDYTIVKGENLKILEKFEKISLTDIYNTGKDTSNLPFSVEPFSSMKLCLSQEGSYCVYVELGLLIFYYLVNFYKKAIEEFLDVLEEMNKDKFVPVKLTEQNIYEIDFYYLKSKEGIFFGIENFNRVFALFGQSNNGIFYVNNKLEFIVDKGRIDNILNYIEKINFTVFED